MPRLSKEKELEKWMQPYHVFSYKITYDTYDLNVSVLAESKEEVDLKKYKPWISCVLVHVSNRIVVC
jgi:hypothetical protein